ncbi:MAG: aldo/keto reductase [Rickettsiales bacterium]|nr:aldo/keto reductase [Rickettsiales bacterium]
MGTWLTFDIGYNTKKLLQRTEVLKIFFKYGGGLIDSSPMYGTSERVIGKCLNNINENYNLISATKVWTPNTWHGIKQVENSLNYWNLNKLDLLQVHNLVNYENHLEKLFQYKKDNKINYIGITTSHGWRHNKTKEIMERYDIDFVQFTYNIVDREAEKYLLELAHEKKISVIANRPFQGGNLFNLVKNKNIPSWAKDQGIKTWSSFFLKYIISHKAITCAIPATSKIEHMQENMEAMYGFYPDKAFRKKMESHIINI